MSVRFVALLVMVASLLTATPAFAQTTPITIGNVHKLNSRPLGEKRSIAVVLPPGYAKDTARRYPVLYLIDGGVEQDLLHVSGVAQLGGIWGRNADIIIVGIETKDRRRELVGPTKDAELLKKYPTAGQSATFRSFIAAEVKPFVERTYRTNDRDAVLGESLAGLFIVETFLAQPALFDAYAAIDPSLWWDKEALSLGASGQAGLAQKDRPLYLAMALEQSETPAAMNRIVASVYQAGARLCLAARPDLTHATIYQQLTPQVLQFLFPPAEAPAAEFGFEVKCSPKS